MAHLHSDTHINEAVASARQAGLRYGTDRGRGWIRKRHGSGFHYVDARGIVAGAAVARRIRALAIPPAWQDVWIAKDSRAHLQATGRDARGRKQYRYHPDWRRVRNESKYDRLRLFGRALRAIRRQVARDLRAQALSRAWILATIVRVLEESVIRIGNEQYRKANGSFGLTTLEARHAQVHASAITLRFRAKSGVMQTIHIHDATLARRVRRCQELPGQLLFQYLDHHGRRHAVGSTDVNTYLREAAGAVFTAKDFRTWAGTLVAAQAFARLPAARSLSQAAIKRHIVSVVDDVAARLGNTRAVCRQSYMHPVVTEHYVRGTTIEALRGASSQGLSPDERALLALLEKPLPRETQSRAANKALAA